jgi:DNA polymerase-1
MKKVLIVGTDYSEIEQRIAASLKEKGFDVHTAKAAEIFGVSIDEVTPKMRRVGKQRNIIKYYTSLTGRYNKGE